MTNEQIKKSIRIISRNFSPPKDVGEEELQENLLTLLESALVNLNDIAAALRAPRQ